MTPTETTIVEPAAAAPRPYLAWGAIAGGAALAAAIAIILAGFGAAVGIGVVSPFGDDGLSVSSVGMIGAGWFLVTSAFAYYVGGYVAGRMRPLAGDADGDEVEVRDGMNGAVVWAIGTLIFALLATSATSSLVTGASRVGSAAASAVATAGASAADTVGDYTTDQLFRQPEQPRSVTRGAEIRGEAGTILTRALADGELNEEDRTYLGDLIASQTALTDEEALARVDQVFADARQTAEQAATAAEEAADAAQTTTLLLGFLTAAGFAVAFAGAWFGATMGGSHRDANIVPRMLVSRRGA